MLGVYNGADCQIVFLDTPGLHKPVHALNKLMVRTALTTLEDVETVLFVVEASRKGLEEGRRVAKILAEAKKPTVLALNKVDLVPDKPRLLPMLEEVSSWGRWEAIAPISAIKGDGAEAVLDELTALLPGGPAHLPRGHDHRPERAVFGG